MGRNDKSVKRVLLDPGIIWRKRKMMPVGELHWREIEPHFAAHFGITTEQIFAFSERAHLPFAAICLAQSPSGKWFPQWIGKYGRYEESWRYFHNRRLAA